MIPPTAGPTAELKGGRHASSMRRTHHCRRRNAGDAARSTGRRLRFDFAGYLRAHYEDYGRIIREAKLKAQ